MLRAFEKMDMKRSNDANAPSLQPTTLQKIFPVAKGDGEESYTKNSHAQSFIIKDMMPALDESLEAMPLPSTLLASTTEGPVRVADLGSSSGPNTVSISADIVDKLRHRFPKDTEFQAYFNELPSNDFNNLFQLLNNDGRAKNFYAAGVPGSFFDRLFPRSSVHVFHSATSLHWLSKIPDGILDEGSPAYNRGEVWYQHSRSAVAKSYQQQALIDLKSFFQARAAEMVSVGLLFILLFGRDTSEPNEAQGDFLYHIMSVLNETFSGLVAEGLLTERQYDNFNFPTYSRSGEDVNEALKCCDSMFNLVTLNLHTVDLSELIAAGGPTAVPKTVTAMVKAGMSQQVEAHFGKSVEEVIWERYAELMEKKAGFRSYISKLQIAGLIRK